MNFEQLVQQVFGGARFAHKHLEESYVTAYSLATANADEQSVEIIGPSGCSKSTLRRLLEVSLLEPPAQWAKGAKHIISIRASNTQDGFFDSKDFYSRLLYLLGDPFRANGKLAFAYQPIDQADAAVEAAVMDPGWRKVHISYTETDIRDACERIGIARCLKFLVVDEAHVMGLVKRSREAVSHLESLRAYAETVGCKLILLGTYHLLNVWQTSAEINRRLGPVHLRRYRDSDEDELNEFARCVVLLANGYAFDAEDFLKQNIRFIYGVTLGSIGEVHDLYLRASASAAAASRAVISYEDLVAGAHSQDQLWTMYEETLAGEQRFARPTDEFLRELTKVRHGPSQGAQAPESVRRNRRPGRRRPTRDAVGADLS
jgi:hypothetical protein